MASGTKYGAGAFNAAQGTGNTVEVYSGFGGAAPAHFMRFAAMTENRTLGFFDNGDQGCFSYITYSGEQRYKSGGIAWLGDNDDSTSALNDQFVHFSFYGPGFINDGGGSPSADYYYAPRSASVNSGTITSNANGTQLPNTTAYSTLNFQIKSGGQQYNWNSITLIDSTGENVQRAIFDSGQRASVLVIFGNYDYNAINSQFTPINRFTLGIFDVGSTVGNKPRGWGFHRGYWTGNGLTDLNGVSRDRLANLRLSPDGFRWQITPSSLSNAGTLTLEVTSAFNTIAQTPTLQLVSFELMDVTGYKIDATQLNMINSTDQVFELQTNSVKPEAAYSIMSLVKSIDYYPTSADENCHGFSQGFWTSSDGGSFCGNYTQYKPNTSDLVNVTANNWWQYMYNSYSGSFAFGITNSVTPKNNALDLWIDVDSPTLHSGSVLCYFIMGEKVAAPEHLMDANSVSILLADDSDYYDNLMLVGSSAPSSVAPPDPSLLKRTFPTTDDRIFPDPLTDVRAFPSD